MYHACELHCSLSITQNAGSNMSAPTAVRPEPEAVTRLISTTRDVHPRPPGWSFRRHIEPLDFLGLHRPDAAVERLVTTELNAHARPPAEPPLDFNLPAYCHRNPPPRPPLGFFLFVPQAPDGPDEEGKKDCNHGVD